MQHSNDREKKSHQINFECENQEMTLNETIPREYVDWPSEDPAKALSIEH